MQWSSIPSVKQLIAIGAGTGDVLSQCLTIPADSVTVFEADATLAQQLAKQFAGNKALNVKAHAVSDQAGTAVMSCFNLAQCNALAPATALLAELFPGLKVLPEKEVQTLALANELNAIKLHGQQNMLLLELPAQNLALLTHLAETDILQHFSHLVVQHSEQPLYKSAAPLNELTQYLAANGFELSETDNSDADFPLLRFYRDAQAQQLKQANQRIAELTTQLETEQQQRQQAKQQHDEALNAQSTTQAELTKQLDAAKQQLDAAKQQFANEQQQGEQAKAELAKQFEAAKQQFATEQQQSEQAKAELKKQFDAGKQQLDSVKQQASADKQQAEQDKTELAKQLEAAKQQLAKEQQQSEQAKAELVKQLEAAKQQAEQAKVELAKQLQAAQQQVTALNNTQTALNTKIADSDSQSKQLNTAKAELEQELKRTSQSLKQESELNQKHKSWAETLKTQNEQLNKELKEQQRSSQLSVKLLAKVEADASELRGRYAQLLKTEQELRSLIGELYIKLSAASKFYNQLEQEHPELLEVKPAR
ncbi:hypothetical protein [Rheinheimera baltica]|uniref:hypothetical protein n=1 Tax=Rheinheimera baltica TaxID=67576 RepID=UPI00273D5B33|nr:hypothetical protein [Rheinheimera baltica]MDP5191305.1 hypothetical protein [Rheinheimera baltica]